MSERTLVCLRELHPALLDNDLHVCPPAELGIVEKPQQAILEQTPGSSSVVAQRRSVVEARARM